MRKDTQEYRIALGYSDALSLVEVARYNLQHDYSANAWDRLMHVRQYLYKQYVKAIDCL